MRCFVVGIFAVISVADVYPNVIVLKEGNFTIQPRDGNFTIQPRDGNFKIQLRDGNFTIQPRACQCGLKPVSRIVGGTQAKMNEFPWMVALCQGSPCTYQKQFCGATLINNLYLITAAHCIEGMRASELSVSLGDFNIASATETNSIERRVVKIIKHEGYAPGSERNDIAILKLDSEVPISNKIRPACLPTPRVQYANRYAISSGWGMTSSGGSSPTTLREVAVLVTTNARCRDQYSQSAITNCMLCAGSRNRDSCQGDSGGPLVLNQGGKFQLIGVTSWGYGCGDARYPGVYTRVICYVQWINANTADAVKCS